MTENDKALVPAKHDDNWQAITDELVAQLTGEDLPDKVVKATEMLLAGYPTYKVAKKLYVSSQTIRRWMTTYPLMSAVIAKGRAALSQWRMQKLEQQFLSAVERSEEILNLPLDGVISDLGEDGAKVDPKVLTVVAAQSRYIIGLFAGQKIDIDVHHDYSDAIVKAKTDALQYITDRLLEQQAKAIDEPIETTFRVIDNKSNDSGPMLDDEGNPPFGEFGIMDTDEDGTLCHICGRRYKSLQKHVLTAHNMSTSEYEELYMIEPGTLYKL